MAIQIIGAHIGEVTWRVMAADIVAMAEALRLLVGGSVRARAITFGLLCLVLQASRPATMGGAGHRPTSACAGLVRGGSHGPDSGGDVRYAVTSVCSTSTT